jgi:tetratricopeptide (TPR) repeat protein
MRRLSFILFFLVLFKPFLWADILSDADAMFGKDDFRGAKPKYETLLKTKPQDAALNYKYGVCLFRLGDWEAAVKPLTLAAKKLGIANIVLGDVYYQKYDFEESLEYYNKALATTEITTIPEIEKAITRTERAKNMLQSVEEIQIMDSLIVSKKDFFDYYNLSDDAGEIFAAEDNDTNGLFPRTKYVTPRKDRELTTRLVDASTDIFLTTKLLDGQTESASLSENINTEANENFPFLMPDGITLYFASDGENSIGGYDIFVSRYSSANNDFFKPENIGMPFNSTANDFMFAIDEEENVGYFATDRHQSQDKVIIYKFKPNATKVLLETDDAAERIAYAQLKKYTLFSDEKKEKKKEMVTPKTKTEIFFVVTDSIIYTSLEQFESKDALEAYQTAGKLEIDNAEKKRFMEQKRMEYLSANEEEKQALIKEISLLEQEINTPNQSPEDYFKLARKLEIEARNKKLLPEEE